MAWGPEFDLDQEALPETGFICAGEILRAGWGRDMLDVRAIRATPLQSAPFPHFVAQNVLARPSLEAVNKDFPDIRSPGIFPVEDLQAGPAFRQLVAEIEAEELEAALSEKYRIDLGKLPLMMTARGICRQRDGRIHVDSVDKVVTCLLYLNLEPWAAPGGQLRLLRNGTDLQDYFAEVPPAGGTFVSFRRTNNSWHGHESFSGPRRYIMFNWMTSDSALKRNVGRHHLSAAIKALFRGNRAADY